MSTHVGIWIRVSTEDQAKGESPKNHQHRARMYAELKGWKIIEVYDLSGVSGKSVIDHPEAKKMLQDVSSGKIHALIFSKLARLARNVKELLELSEHFQKYNANLVSLEETIDTSTPAGRLLFTVIGALAQWEREEISARVAASVPVRARQGKPTGGLGPFGYMWAKVGEGDSKRLIPNPKEAPIVKRVFELFLEKQKLLPTCKALNSEGLRAKKSTFMPVTLKRILTDSTYKGLRRANYSKSKGNKKSWKLKPRNEWVYHEVEPLVSYEVFDKVNEIIQGNAKKYGNPKGIPKETKYLFGSLLLCECGTKMYVLPYEGMKVNRYTCRKCRSKINEDVIVEQFLEGLKGMVLRPDQLEAKDDSRASLNEKKERLKLLHKELQTAKSKIDSLFDLYHSGSVDKPNFTERFNDLKQRKEQIVKEIPKLEGEIDFIKIAALGKDYILAQAKSFSSMWPLLNDNEKKRLVAEILESIKVGKDTLTFSFFYLPEFMPVGKGYRTDRGAVTFSYLMPRPLIPPKGYPVNPITLGEHLRKIRMDRGLTQELVGNMLGVGKCTVRNWEVGRTEPELKCIPKIVDFLGYLPINRQGG